MIEIGKGYVRKQVLKKLIEIYVKFKENPKKIFVASDFNNRAIIVDYLQALQKIGLIEEVFAEYEIKKGVRREVVGYKLKRQQNE